jgi:biotin carboxyl carrier protein
VVSVAASLGQQVEGGQLLAVIEPIA